MRPLVILAILAAAAAVPVALAEEPQVAKGLAVAPGKVAGAKVVNVTATVEAVDAATRSVTLKGPKGDQHTIVAGDEVKNFDQIKVGDKVTVKYVEALTIELKKDGKAVVGRTTTSDLQRSAPGQKPGGIAKQEVTIVADVVGVDKKKHTVSVKNEKGEIVDLHVEDPEQIKLVKKGDQIQATYTQAVAIAMHPAAPKK
jgi:hypothetical protein